MKKINITYWSLLFAVLFSFSACQDVEIDQTVEEIMAAQPTIESIEPASSQVMGLVTVKGTFLNFVDAAFIGDTECEIYRKVNSGELIVRVNPMAQSGAIKLTTAAQKEAVAAQQLTVTYATPAITSQLPEEKLVNETIIIEGTDLNVITKVMFGTTEGDIEFQEEEALVVKVPYSEDANNDIKIEYYTSAGASEETIKAGFAILIPVPEVSVWPSLLSPGQDAVISGANMNLVQSVKFGDTDVADFTATAESLSFPIPDGVTTATYTVTLGYEFEGAQEIVSPIIPYVAVNYVTMFDYNIDDESTLEVNKADYALLAQINGDVAPPAFPGSGTGNYLHMKLGKESSSTIYKQRLKNSAYIKETGDYAAFSKVLHFWLNTNNTAPDIQFEIIKNSKATISGYNTGSDWVLVAVRLGDLFPGVVADDYCRFNYRNPGVADAEINMNWVILADEVLTGIGAVDLTDQFN